MLKIARFDYDDVDAFNAFRIEHPPRNTSKADGSAGGGIIIHQSAGLFVFYEDGEPYTKEEQVAWCLEQIRTYKSSIMQSEPMYRILMVQNQEFKDEVEANTKQMEGVPTNSKAYKDLESTNKKIQDRIAGNDNTILLNRVNVEDARNQVQAMKSIIEDLTSGSFVV